MPGNTIGFFEHDQGELVQNDRALIFNKLTAERKLNYLKCKINVKNVKLYG
jgi:hypothetical protein